MSPCALPRTISAVGYGLIVWHYSCLGSSQHRWLPGRLFFQQYLKKITDLGRRSSRWLRPAGGQSQHRQHQCKNGNNLRVFIHDQRLKGLSLKMTDWQVALRFSRRLKVGMNLHRLRLIETRNVYITPRRCNTMRMTAITIRMWIQPPVCGKPAFMLRPKKPSSHQNY